MTPHLSKSILVGCAFFISSTAFAQTQVAITTADGNGADVYVENAKGNFAAGPLVVKNAAREVDDPHFTRKIYIRFDLSTVADRLDDITDAQFSIMTSTNHLGGSSTPARAYTVAVDGLTDESMDLWVENQILWNDAPANILTNNELDPQLITPIGQLEVPEVLAPDLVSLTSEALVDFIQSKTNGVITLILRRTDTDAANNLAFHSKETALGAAPEFIPTLHLTIGGESLPLTFAEAISATEVGGGVIDSAWFGRAIQYDTQWHFTQLGWIWTTLSNSPDSIWFSNLTLNTWMWTAETVYPWVYSVQDGWTYVLNSPDSETYLYFHDAGEWVAHNNFGWTYPLSEQERMDRLLINIPSTARPRILINRDDLPQLREKLKRGWFVDAYAKLKMDAELIMRGELTEGFSATIGRRIHQKIAKLAFVGYVEDSQRHFDYAVNYALHQLDTYTLEQLRMNNAGSPHLGSGDVLHAYAIAFDWLYPYLNIIQRSKIQNFLNELGALQYEAIRTQWNGTNAVNDATNHNPVGGGGLGMAALALGNKPIWIEHAIRQTRRYMQFSTDATGWNFEGRHYFAYGGWGAFPFAEAIVRLGGPDIIAEFPKQNTIATDFFMRQMPPYTYTNGVQSTSYFIARSNDQVGHWIWLKSKGPEGDGTYGSDRDVDHFVYTLLVGNPDMQTTHPRDADLPLDKLFENGRATFRDSWDDHAAVLTYSTGWTVHTGHRMRSENSFNFYALGEEFSIAPEDAAVGIESLFSFVMVDNRRNTRASGEAPYGSVVEEYRSEPDHGYIRGDARNSSAYFVDASGWLSPNQQKVSEATRQLLFARSPDGIAEPYLVIIDDLTTRAETSKFSWLLQTPANNTVDFGDMQDGHFKVTGHKRGAMLNVDFIAPANLTNEMVTHTGFTEYKGRWDAAKIASYLQTPAAVYNGKSVRFIVILRAYDPGASAPDYTFTGTDMDGTITVQLSDGTTDVITIKDHNMTFERTAP